MIKFITAVAAAIMLLGAVTFAKADECQFGTKAELVEILNQTENMTVKELSPADVARVLEKKGTPPNAAEGVDIQVLYANNGELGALFFLQGECFINRIGPVPMYMIEMLFGQVSANRPYRQGLLMQGAAHIG